ncbi:LOW QUALITY PROTEIN: zinc finger protein SNAI3 [Rhinoderma darwinii]|uniref:LOW QUALITY PROTEIN: zinc finger protein SNAI3 n=1 Tax=Rhinoderma darwinii TaxID=43563 RepID=UPI003F6742ED
MSTQIVTVLDWGHRDTWGKWQRMPRSFLVKKPCSHRIPNYGQLLEAQAGLVLSLYQNEDTSIPRPNITDQRKAREATPQIQVGIGHGDNFNKTLLNPLEIRMSDAVLILPNGLPLKDNMNNLNTPLRNRSSDGGCSMPGNKTACNPSSQGELPHVADSVGRLDFPKPGGLFTGNKVRNCRYFSCPHCSKSYSSLGALKMHIRTHTLPCACRICGKAFSRPWLLQGHIRTHTGEKPFSCYHCGRGFADRSNLRAHLQTHSEVKRYRCPGCGKTFSRISLLTKHRDGCCCPVS